MDGRDVSGWGLPVPACRPSQPGAGRPVSSERLPGVSVIISRPGSAARGTCPSFVSPSYLCFAMAVLFTCSLGGLCSAAPVTWRSAQPSIVDEVTWSLSHTGTQEKNGDVVTTTANTTPTTDTTTNTTTTNTSSTGEVTDPHDQPHVSSPRKRSIEVSEVKGNESAPVDISPGVQVRAAGDVGVNSVQITPSRHQGTSGVPSSDDAVRSPVGLLLPEAGNVSDSEVFTRQEGGLTGDLPDVSAVPPTLWTDHVTGVHVTTTAAEEDPSPPSTQEDYTSPYPSPDDVTVDDVTVFENQNGHFEALTVDATESRAENTITDNVTQPEVFTTAGVSQPEVISAWHSSPSPQHGSDDGRGGASPLLTTMLIVAHVQTTLQPTLRPSVTPRTDDGDDYNGNKTSADLQFALKDLILAVCGTAASTFTICMLVTFTRCCCKKQKDDSDGDDDATRRRGAATSAHRGTGAKSLWKRSWRRPLDSAATSGTQESSTSENITQVTIERRESYTDERDSELSDGYDEDDDEGGFTRPGPRRQRQPDGSRSRKSHSKDSDDNATAPSVRDRIRAFEVPAAPGEVKVREGIKPRKNKPTSKAFSEFESKGILIGFGGPRRRQGEDEEEDEDRARDGTCDSPIGMLLPSPTSGQSLEDTPTSSRGLDDDEGVHTMESEEDEFAAIQRNGEVLKSFRRAPPPRNRSRARKSGRGRRQMRGQDVSSSEQIAEEPSSGSFGSRPTSGINSPATSATPEEEHDSFEASLHMTTESLSVARSSSISQTPQSSLDSMDSPKRQPSVSSRESPLRGGSSGLGDSPKRLLDSPKRQIRGGGGEGSSPRNTPPMGQLTRLRPVPVPDPGGAGPADFSLTIPVEFQQQRLGSQPQTSPVKSPVGAGVAGSTSGRSRRPVSYHVDPARMGPAADKFCPLRPLSSIVHPDAPDSAPSPADSSPSSSTTPARPGDRAHFHEPRSHEDHQTHLPPPPRSRDHMSQSQGHLAARDSGTPPVGRVLPQVRQTASPGELRRWESEHSYLQEEGRKPTRLRRDAGRGRGGGDSQPQQPEVPGASQSRHTLRPTPDEGQVREHPQSEKLERKVLMMDTPTGTNLGPDHPSQSGGTGVQISEKDRGKPKFDVPPPRPPLPSWRKMKPAYDSSNHFPLPPRGSRDDSYNEWTRDGHRKVNTKLRSQSFHVSDSWQRQSRSVEYKPKEIEKSWSSRDQSDGLQYITPDDIRKTWNGMARSRSLERPRKRQTSKFALESNPQAYYSLDSHGLMKSKSHDVSLDKMRNTQGFLNNYSVSKSKSLELTSERLSRYQHWRNTEDVAFQDSLNEKIDYEQDKRPLSRPQAARKSWHGNTKSATASQLKSHAKSACGHVPWLRKKENEESQNLKPSDIRKSLREDKKLPSAPPSMTKAGVDRNGMDIKTSNIGNIVNTTAKTDSMNRISKTEGLVGHSSIDFDRNVPQSQSVRASRPPIKYAGGDTRYSMRVRSSNSRNALGEARPPHPAPRKKKHESSATPTRSTLPPAAVSQSPTKVAMPFTITQQQADAEDPPPPRPPLPIMSPAYPADQQPAMEDKSPIPKVANWQIAKMSQVNPGPAFSKWESKDRLEESYRHPENYGSLNRGQAIGIPAEAGELSTASITTNLMEGRFNRKDVINTQDTSGDFVSSVNPQLASTPLYPNKERYWSAERPGARRPHQSQPPDEGPVEPQEDRPYWKPVVDKASLRPDVVDHVVETNTPELQLASEQSQRYQYSMDDSKQGYRSLSQWSAAPSDNLNGMPASGQNYVDMTKNLGRVPSAEISARPKSTLEPSPIPLSSTFSEPSPVPSDLPQSDHVLRFTRDPRWKDSLVKPEAKSMYEVMHGQDFAQSPAFSYTTKPEHQSIESAPLPLLRDTPDVVPISERRISTRSMVSTEGLQFKFNFDAEATDI